MAAKTFKFFWLTHKWTGIILAALIAMTATTGFLLLIKKEFAWIQPPTITGTEGTVQDFIPFQRVVDAVLAAGDPAFATVDDIDRIDVRPDKRVHKVRSRNGFAEIQVDAVTGEILSQGNVRRSDLIESIHDGSFFGGWMHDWVMPLVSIALLFLIGSGFWLWIEPMVRRARRRRRARNSAT